MDTPHPRRDGGMVAEAAAVWTTFKVGRKYWVTATIPPPRPGQVRSAVFEWDPCVPRRLNKAQLATTGGAETPPWPSWRNEPGCE